MDTRSLVNISSSFRSSAKFATAPINLAVRHMCFAADLQSACMSSGTQSTYWNRCQTPTARQSGSGQEGVGGAGGLLGGIRLFSSYSDLADPIRLGRRGAKVLGWMENIPIRSAERNPEVTGTAPRQSDGKGRGGNGAYRRSGCRPFHRSFEYQTLD